MSELLRIAVLGSTRGSNLLPLIQKLEEAGLPHTVVAVVSNRKDAGILEKAKEKKWPNYFISPEGHNRESYDQLLSSQLEALETDLILLVGYMRILSATFINQWRHRIYNVHPSLLPAFAGLMDKAVHQAVIEKQLNETGCTVHEVTETLDEGPIIVQQKCLVYPNDTVETLKARVQSKEVEALAEAVQKFYRERAYV